MPRNIAPEVKDLVLGILGGSFETDLSNDVARLQMEDGSVATHPILGHRAWLLDSWVIKPGSQEQPQPSPVTPLKRRMSKGKGRPYLEDGIGYVWGGGAGRVSIW